MVEGLINIRANATDNEIITKVEFYVDGSKIGEDNTSPYEYNWNTDELAYSSVHSLMAKAFDKAGNSTESSIVTVTITDTKAPEINIINPKHGDSVSGKVKIQLEVVDKIIKPIINKSSSGINKIEIHIDGQLTATLTKIPYEYEWDTSDLQYGSVHTITVKAFDNAKNTSQKSIEVIIGDNQPPTVSFINPTNNSVVAGSVKIQVSAEDKVIIFDKNNKIISRSPSGINKVEFYIDDNLIGDDTVAPYEMNWNTGNYLDGEHTIKAKAIDKVGLYSEASIIVKVDNTKPNISITEPINNSLLNGTINIKATANDVNGISKVEFYVGSSPIGEDDSSPYEISWDSKSVSDGVHIITAKAYDVANNTNTASITVNIDNTGPILNITQPNNNQILKGNVPIRIDAQDSHGVSKVEVLIDNQIKATLTNTPYEYVWNSDVYQEGSHEIRARGYDSLNNISETSINVIVDRTPPSVSITYPTNNAVVGGALTIKTNINDTYGVDKVEFYLNDVLLGTIVTSPYQIDWDTRTYTEGNYTIKVKAYDKAGNTNEVSISVRVDNTAPFVNITNPQDGVYVKGTITIQATATSQLGVSRVEFYVDNNKIGEDTSSPYEISWNTSNVSDGSHVLKAKAYDIAGNSRESEVINVIVDNTLPSVSITSPTNNSVIDGIVTIEVNANDNFEVLKVEFYVDNNNIGEDTESPYEKSWDFDNLSYSTSHVITAKAYDKAGNVSSHSINITIGDTKAPEITFINPKDGDKVTGTVKIQVTVVDKAPGIKNLDRSPSGTNKVEFYIDGVLKMTDTSEPYEYNWSTTGLEYNSSHTITVKAYDRVGKVGEKSITVKIGDTLAPSVTIDTPTNNALVSGTFTITASVIDKVNSKDIVINKAPSGISKVEFYLDNNLKGTSTQSPYQCVVDSRQETDGNHTILVKAYDLENNEGTATISITIDNTPPTVSIIEPLGGEVTGTVTIRVSANDTNGIQKVEFYVNNVKKGEDLEEPFTYDWNTATLAYGSTHTIFAKAYDKAGNIATSNSITVTIGDNLPPLITITSPPNNSYVSGYVNIFASVIDKVMGENSKIIEKGPSGVSYVEFFIDNVSVKNFISGPYTYTWNTFNYADGIHNIKVEATDNVGNTASTSIQVTVDNTLPIVNILSPYEGEVVKGMVNVSVYADDNYGIGKIEFYADGNKRGELTQSPYTWTWNSTSVLNGNHTLTVKVYDLANNMTERSVTVIVNNWQKVFGDEWDDENGYAMVRTADSGYLIGGRKGYYGLYLLKLNSNGDLIDLRTYWEGNYYQRIRSIDLSYDGGYITGGRLDWSNGFVYKLDTNLDKTYNKLFSGGERTEVFSVIQTSDFCILVGGRVNNEAFVEKIDIWGNTMWRKVFSGDYYAKVYDVEEMSDANYLIIGRYDYGNIFLAKLDPINGNIIWQRYLWLDQNWDWEYYNWSEFSVKETHEGDIIICGYRWGDRWIYVAKLDSEGNMIWEKQLNRQGVARRVLLTPDGGYIFVGSTSTNTYGGYDAYVFKLDANGNLLWEVNVGGASDDQGWDIAETNDGCYLVAGETCSFGGGWQVFVFKIDANGNLQ